MKLRTVALEAVCGRKDQFPEPRLPEICFIGRSNVGKSSLINALTGRKALARTSQSPGKTRTINFYNVNDTLYLVDLPGYGYAKVSQAEQKRWGQIIESYLKERESLCLAVLLVDIRHEPGEADRMMFDWMRYYGIEPLIVLTKLDKIKKNQLQKQLALIARGLGVEDRNNILAVSSETKTGIDALWQRMESVAFEEEAIDEAPTSDSERS